MPQAGPDVSVMILERSELRAQADQGGGGRMEIIGDLFFASAEPATVVSTSSAAGPQRDGEIVITAPDSTIVGTLAAIPAVFLDAAGLIREQCAVRQPDSGGSLLVRGRGGVPPTPNAVLPAPLPTSREARLGVSGPTQVAAPLGTLTDGRPVLLTVHSAASAQRAAKSRGLRPSAECFGVAPLVDSSGRCARPNSGYTTE